MTISLCDNSDIGNGIFLLDVDFISNLRGVGLLLLLTSTLLLPLPSPLYIQ